MTNIMGFGGCDIFRQGPQLRDAFDPGMDQKLQFSWAWLINCCVSAHASLVGLDDFRPNIF